jgi:hypothetical protein
VGKNMKEKWISLGFNAKEILTIQQFITYRDGIILPYIRDIHFAHFDNKILPSGRCSTKFSKKEAKYFMKMCLDNGIKTALLLNFGNYNFNDIVKILEKFYLPLGLSSLVISDKYLAGELKFRYPELTIQGSCISYIDTIEGLFDEQKYGIEIHNPATWTIRNMPFIKDVNDKGLKQKHMISEGCVRKCPLELWHRKEVLSDTYHGFYTSCYKSVKDIYVFLMGNWITMKQLKRMEEYIDVLKLPRSTFSNYGELYRFINLYDSGEPYNILDFWGTPLAQIRHDNAIMSDVFDDEFFDNTISDEINKDFLEQYVSRLNKIPFFTDRSINCK